jgi:hypothetical protein
MSLRGTAQRILSELSPDQLSNYSTLTFCLTQRFCPAEREAAHRCEFRARKRLQGESVSDYGYALNRLANRTFPNIPLSSRESLVIDQYISGLGDLELKKYVQFAHLSTLDKAISLAVEFEGTHSKTLVKPRNHEQDMILNQSSVRAVQKDEIASQSERSALSEITKAVKELQSTLNESTQSYGSLKNQVLYLRKTWTY